MQSFFLEELAEKIYQKHRNNFLDLCMVFPSRRAVTYFQHFLTQKTEKPCFLPLSFAIEDFVRQMSGLQIPAQADLLLRLFDAYKMFDTKKEHTLVRFVSLGTVLLRDFNTIDKYLDEAQASQFFAYLKEVKALERWGEALGEEIDPKKHRNLSDYFSFWHHLEKTYHLFKQRLLAEGLGYSGLAYRKMSTNSAEILSESGIAHVVFAGFSQLSAAEESMIEKLCKAQKATVYWDADNYYVQRSWHEAGSFIRKYRKKGLVKTEHFPDRIGQNKKEIVLAAATDELSQLRYAGELIAQTFGQAAANKTLARFERTINHTAILLPDATMLKPLLHSLPALEARQPGISHFLNITMGLSLAESQFADLIDLLFKIQLRLPKQQPWKIYHKDLDALFAHPFLLFENSLKEHIAQMHKTLRDENMTYLTEAMYAQLKSAKPILNLLLSPWEADTFKGIAQLKALCSYLSELPKVQERASEQDIFYAFYLVLNNLEDLLLAHKKEIKIETFRYFLFEIIKNTNVPFSTTPLSPLQIMGMLESRLLDFKHLIVLSCNEGSFPKGKAVDSLLPFSLRKQYGLPTHEENEGNFAYTFFRLFQRAEKITLIYSQAPDTEVSRFVSQIRQEWQQMPNISIRALNIRLPAPAFSGKETPEIAKDAFVVAKIEALMRRGSSPSALNTYIKSPQAFFVRYLLRLKEAEMVEEFLAYDTFGSMLHYTLESIFKPYLHKEVHPEEMKMLAKNRDKIQSILREAVRKKLGEIDLDTGKNYLLKEAALELVVRFLRNANQGQVSRIIDLENFHAAQLQVKTEDGKTIPFRIAGMADRIDLQQENGRYELKIIDYKSGAYIPQQLQAKTMADLLIKPEKEKIVQLMLYKYIVIQEIREGRFKNLPPDFSLEKDRISAGFVFLRNPEEAYVEYRLSDAPSDDNLAFEKYAALFLEIIAKDLLNNQKPFTKNPSDFEPFVGSL